MEWQLTELHSPHLDAPVPVVAAKSIPSVPNANRFETLNIYLPRTSATIKLVGQPVTSLPNVDSVFVVPSIQVHVHGGAWRDPQLTASSIEAAAAHAFSATDAVNPITAIASINYTLSPFPTHPTLPYDPIKNNHSDPSREAVHPKHVHDVLSALSVLRTFGLTDGSYILSGHSAGACLIFQSILQAPQHWGFEDISDAPRPAALLGMNGLYDLPDLVHNLGTSHAHLKEVYANLQGIAFGNDEATWRSASPTSVNLEDLSQRIETGKIPRLIVLDQSLEDQLVPVNQTEKLESVLRQVPGLEVHRGHRCTGKHAAPWEEGYMIWDSVQDILKLLSMKI